MARDPRLVVGGGVRSGKEGKKGVGGTARGGREDLITTSLFLR